MEQDAIDQAWFDFALKLYGLAISVVAEPELAITSKGSADPKVIATTLLIRTASNFRGALALAQIGLTVETRTLTRCCVENLLWLGRLLSEGDAFVQEMASDEAKSRIKRASFVSGQAVKIDAKILAKMEKATAALKERWPKAKILSPSTVASGSAVESIYLLYSQLSADAAHPSMSALERYLVRDIAVDGTEIRGIDLMPKARPGELATTVNYACTALMGACVAFNDIAGPTEGGRQFIPITEEYEALKTSTGVG